MIVTELGKLYQSIRVQVQEKIIASFGTQWKLKYIDRALISISLVVIFIQFNIIYSPSSQKHPLVNDSATHLKSQDLKSKPSSKKQIPAQCKLPKLIPFHPSILRFFNETVKLPKCSDNFTLLYKVDYNANLVALKSVREAGFNECSYCQLVRKTGNDDKFRISSNCIQITRSSTKIDKDYEYIAIKCKKLGSKQTHVIDIFAVVRPKPEILDRINIQKLKLKSTKEPQLNVIVLGIDSVSQMSFLRSMNKTSGYLRKLNAIGMNGYTKHAENTFGNVASVLTGKSVRELMLSCWKKVFDRFDDCPFIWKKFSEQGYVTSYLEDDPQLAAFNSNRKGFTNPPVDYYLRPANFALFKRLGHSRLGSPTICLGPRLSFDISMDYLKRVIHTNEKVGKYFMFSWTDSITHDFITSSRLVDGKTFRAIKWLNDAKHLKNTVLVLMSDHGLRHGDFTNTYQGSTEIRMPMLYFLFPQWFLKRYPNGIKNLKENSQRLSTHFDLHETLLDILYLGNVTDAKIKLRTEKLAANFKAGKPPRGISLFLPIPSTRTCKSAGIGESDCLCREMRETGLETNETLEAALTLVNSINNRLTNYPECSKLKLLKVFAAVTPDVGYIKNLRITMSTSPGGASFQGTVLRKYDSTNINTNKSVWKLSGIISRTNIYRLQSQCVKDANVKPYCYCAPITSTTSEPSMSE